MEGESMKVGIDGGIRLEFHGAKVTSDDGLLVYRDLDDALGLFDPPLPIFLTIAQGIISNMLCSLSCVNR